MKRVLDVGNCAMDHGAIKDILTDHFDVQVLQANSHEEAISLLEGSTSVDLVLVNRICDYDGTEGLELIQQLTTNPTLANKPVMLITNIADQQQVATEFGAVPGFGKNDLHEEKTIRILRPFLA